MKTYIAHVYQPREEIPTQLSEFKNSLSQYSSTMEDAEVHILYIEQGTELTEEYKWIKENATNVVAIVPSNKFRRFAPKDLTWQECISLKRKKDVESILQKLNANEWSGLSTLEEKAEKRRLKQLEKEKRKEEKAKKKEAKHKRKMEKAGLKLINLSDNETVMDVPEGATKLKFQLLVSWE